ncbi:MAG: thioesterase family protein [Faecalibacterium sp.]
MLQPGIRGTSSQPVTPENTARAMGSGTLEVFATPALVALAEKTCWQSVAAQLESGSGTVGTRLELEHTAPTPVGMTVTCESELTAVEGRKLVFHVELRDEKGPVGSGVHERFVINDAKFAAKAEAKKG